MYELYNNQWQMYIYNICCVSKIRHCWSAHKHRMTSTNETRYGTIFFELHTTLSVFKSFQTRRYDFAEKRNTLSVTFKLCWNMLNSSCSKSKALFRFSSKCKKINKIIQKCDVIITSYAHLKCNYSEYWSHW